MSINGTDPKLLNNSVCFFSYTKNKLMPHKPKHFVLNTWRHSSYNCWSCSLIKARVPSYSCGSLASHTRSVLMPCPLAGIDSVQIQQNTPVTTSKPIYTLHPSIHAPPLSLPSQLFTVCPSLFWLMFPRDPLHPFTNFQTEMCSFHCIT